MTISYLVFPVAFKEPVNNIIEDPALEYWGKTPPQLALVKLIWQIKELETILQKRNPDI